MTRMLPEKMDIGRYTVWSLRTRNRAGHEKHGLLNIHEPESFLTKGERDMLLHVQYAILQRASGIPYAHGGREDHDGR